MQQFIRNTNGALAQMRRAGQRVEPPSACSLCSRQHLCTTAVADCSSIVGLALSAFETSVFPALYFRMDLQCSPWFWEKMSVMGSCSQSLRRGGTEQDARGSSSGRVLMLKDSAEFTNAALMSSMWRAEADLPFSSNISSPIFKPEKVEKNCE